MGHMQYRRGPRHHGPHGIWQTVFDTIKLLGKEDIIPSGVDRWTFIWAPMIIFVPSLMAFVFLPFAEKIAATNIEISLFFVLADHGPVDNCAFYGRLGFKQQICFCLEECEARPR